MYIQILVVTNRERNVEILSDFSRHRHAEEQHAAPKSL